MEQVFASPFRMFDAGAESGRRDAAHNALAQYAMPAMQGDKAALNALAATSPLAAMQIHGQLQDRQRQDARLAMEQERLGMARAAAAREIERLGEAEALQEFQRDVQVYSTALRAFEAGDRATFDRLTRGNQDYEGVTWDTFPQFQPEAEIALEGAILAFENRPGEADDQRARKINDAMRLYGLNEADATALVDGHVGVDRDPLTRDVTTYDKRSIFNTPQQSAPVADNRAPSEEPLKFNIPGANDSFGLEGFGKRALNTGADIVGAQVPFPEVQDAQSDFATFREDVLSSIAAGYDRQPPSWLLQALRDLTPEAGNPLQGAQGAQSKLRALVRKFDRELQVQERQLQRRQSPQDRAESERRVAALEATRDYVSATLRAFDSGGGDVPPAFANEVGDLEDGLTAQDVWDSMTDEQRRLWAK